MPTIHQPHGSAPADVVCLRPFRRWRLVFVLPSFVAPTAAMLEPGETEPERRGERGQTMTSFETAARRDEPTDIVVGVDGSAAAMFALRWAAAQARLTGARVHAVIAWAPPALYAWDAVVPDVDLAGTAGKVLSRSVQEVLGSEPDVTVEETVMPGHPAQVLIDASRSAALLVVGCRGHGGFTGALLGSVGLRCAQYAKCPVVVVRGKG